MERLFLKYLVTKMTLGYGDSFDYTELSKLYSYLYSNNIKFNDGYDNNYIDYNNNNNTFTAKYTINREVIDLFKIKKEEFDLLRNFINKYLSYNDVLNNIVNENDLKRSEELAIYLIDTFNLIKNNSHYISFDDMKKYPINKDFIKLFDDLSKCIAYLLKNDKDLIISNMNIGNNKLLPYKAFGNYAIIDRNLNHQLYAYTRKDKYTFYIDFSNDKYYGIPLYKQDMLIVTRDNSIYGPIYIPRVENADKSIIIKKEKAIENARSMIKKLKKD